MTKNLEPDRTVARDRPVSLTVEDFSHVNNAGGYIPPVNQDILKVVVRISDFFDHCGQDGHERFALQGWANIAERYLAGSIYLRIGAFWSDGSIERQLGKYYALIQVAGTGKNDPSLVDNEPLHTSHTPLGINGNEFHMLVDVRHSKNIPENFVPSVVRLCPENGLSQIAVEAAKVSNHVPMLVKSPTIGLEVFPSVPRGELNPFGVDMRLAQPSECNSGLIQRRTQMVDKFASQDVHDLWRARIHNDFCEFVAGLRIRIVNDPARVLFEKLPLGAFKLDEVVLCAF